MVNATKAALLNHYFGGPDLARPSNLYVGLSTTTPTATGSNFTQPSGNGYARAQIVNTGASWNTATTADPSVKSNAQTIEFSTATGNWGTITHWGLFTASSGGTPIVTGAIVDAGGNPSPKTISAGMKPEIAPGALQIRLRNG